MTILQIWCSIKTKQIDYFNNKNNGNVIINNIFEAYSIKYL